MKPRSVVLKFFRFGMTVWRSLGDTPNHVPIVAPHCSTEVDGRSRPRPTWFGPPLASTGAEPKKDLPRTESLWVALLRCFRQKLPRFAEITATFRVRHPTLGSSPD